MGFGLEDKDALDDIHQFSLLLESCDFEVFTGSWPDHGDGLAKFRQAFVEVRR